MGTAELKASVIGVIDAHRRQLAALSRKIHENPEVAFEEERAAAELVKFLEEGNFTVEKGIGKLPTAFRGRYGEGRPALAVLAEYDALPKIGHACGHNLIATVAVATGLAARKAVDSLGGSVLVIGTPGEELYGGKAIMVERGCFDDIDIALIAHPGGGNRVIMNTLACQTLDVEFIGRAAHAGAQPEAGINALEALIQSFNAINSLRQHIKDRARISGIITDGGEAANIVPAHSAGSFIIRAENDSYLDELKERVIGCFAGAAAATGAKLEYRWGERYAAMYNSQIMARMFRDNMKTLGHNIHLGEDVYMNFSTDVGNVSQRVPTIQPLVGIAPDDVLIHTPEFARIAAMEAALDGMLDAAKAFAMMIIDLLADPGIIEKIKGEFGKG